MSELAAELGPSLRLEGVAWPGLLLCVLCCVPGRVVCPGGWGRSARGGWLQCGVASTFADSQVPSGTARLLMYKLVPAVLKARGERGRGIFLLVAAHAQPCIAPQKRLFRKPGFLRIAAGSGKAALVGDGADERFHSNRPPPSAPVNACPDYTRSAATQQAVP